jgi:hypothetical protein
MLRKPLPHKHLASGRLDLDFLTPALSLFGITANPTILKTVFHASGNSTAIADLIGKDFQFKTFLATKFIA